MTYSKSVLLTAVLVCSAVSANASTSDKKLALEAVKNYATSIACNTTFDTNSEDFKTTLKNVYEIDLSATSVEPEPDYATNPEYYADLGGRDYLVYWGGDEGCYGGSGTYSYYITPVSRMTDTKPFTVKTSNYNIVTGLYEDPQTINSRFIENVTVKNNIVEVISSDYSDGDCNNCASLRYKYKIIYEPYPSSMGWVLLDSEFLGKRAPRTDFD